MSDSGSGDTTAGGQSENDTPEDEAASEREASETAPSDSDQDSGTNDSPAEDEPESAVGGTDPAGPNVFKDSGSFFRERVARVLAEQGYHFNEDGTWGEDATTGSAAPNSATEQGTAPHDAGTGSGAESETSPDSDTDAVPETGPAGSGEQPTAVTDESRESDGSPEISEIEDAGTATVESAEDSLAGSIPTGDTPVGEPSDTAWLGRPGAGEEDSSWAGAPEISDDAAVEDEPASGGTEPDPVVPESFGVEPDGSAGPATEDLTVRFPTMPPDEPPTDTAGPEPATSAAPPDPFDGESPATPEESPEPTSPFEPHTADDADLAPPTTDTSVGTAPTAGASAEAPEDTGVTPPSGPPAHDTAVPHHSPSVGARPDGATSAGPGDGVAEPPSSPEVPTGSAVAGAGQDGPGTPVDDAPTAAAASAGGADPRPAGGGPGGPGVPAGAGGSTDPSGRPAAATSTTTAVRAKLGGQRKSKGTAPAKSAHPLWWRWTRGGLIVAGVLFVLGIVGFGIAYAVIPVPDAAKAAATDQGTTFYYSDGETEFGERGVNREPVDVESVPQHVQGSVTSAEDRGFWTEPGVSVTGTVRAAWSTLTGQQLQGGSTITQQMVRNYYEGVSREQTISRKFKEIIISLKVDRSRSKEWVMEQYLNTIYFGRNAYGIQAAAEAYYYKDVEELEPGEAAFLAAAIQQPTKFGEADSATTDAMEYRWEAVVEGMVETDVLSASDAEALEFPAPEARKPQTDLSGYKGYMIQQAMSELEDLGYTEDNINRGGYRVVTTFDEDLMEAAKNAVESTIDPDALPEGVRAGLAAIDPETGEVVAFYGGEDYNENQYDSAFRGSAQVGSAMKPYVLATALKNGYSLHSQVDGRGPQNIHGASIQNAGNASGGPMNLIEATRKSNNTGYVNLAMEVGLEEVVETAYEVGLPEGSIGDHQVVPTLALGINDVRPVDEASGFATFANGGEHIEPHVVREIQNPEGENLRDEVPSNEALTEGQAADVTHALQQVVRSGTGTQARLSDGRPVAGKTGTTDNSVATWFSGYTPQLSTAVGVYNSNNNPFSVPGWGSLSGGTLSATIWREFMTTAMEGKEVERFPDPSYGGTTEDWAPDVPSGEPEETEPDNPLESEQPVPETPEVGRPDRGEPDPGDTAPGEPDLEPDPGDTGDTENPEETPDDSTSEDPGGGDESDSGELE